MQRYCAPSLSSCTPQTHCAWVRTETRSCDFTAHMCTGMILSNYKLFVNPLFTRSCDFTAHMCTGMIPSNYKLFVNPLFKLISIEHVIIGSKTQWKTI